MISIATTALVDAEALRRQRSLNPLQSAILLVGLFALAALTGFLFAGTDGLVIAAAIAAGFMILNPASGEILFQYIYGAVPLTPSSAPRLSSLVAELARRAELERHPALLLIPTPLLQAMGAGSREAPSMAVTSGLLQQLPVARARGGAGERGHAYPSRRHVRHAPRGGRRRHDPRDGQRRDLPRDRVPAGPVVDRIGAVAGGDRPADDRTDGERSAPSCRCRAAASSWPMRAPSS